jgi:TonB family protein
MMRFVLVFGLLVAGAFAPPQAPSPLPEAPSTAGAPDAPGIYTVGNGVTAPRVVFAPEPEFSEEARKHKISGNVLVSLVVGVDGKPSDIKVTKSIGEVLAPKSKKVALSLDEKALEAVRQYRFEPAMFEGHPVPVRLTVAINFQIF